MKAMKPMKDCERDEVDEGQRHRRRNVRQAKEGDLVTNKRVKIVSKKSPAPGKSSYKKIEAWTEW